MKALVWILAAALPWVAIVVFCSGCTAMAGEDLFTGQDEGRFLLSADAEGIRAFGDSMNGLITEGKASPDVKSAYWQNADARVEVKKFRMFGQMKTAKAGAK